MSLALRCGVRNSVRALSRKSSRSLTSGSTSGVSQQFERKVLSQLQRCQEQSRIFHVASSLQSKTGGENGGETGGSDQGTGGEEGRVRPCSNCGGALHIDSSVMINGFVKCDSCKQMIMVSEEEVDQEFLSTEEEDKGYIPTPKEIHRFLDEHVIGQEMAKKSLAVASYNHYKRVKWAKSSSQTTQPKAKLGENLFAESLEAAIRGHASSALGFNSHQKEESDPPLMSPEDDSKQITLQKSNVLMLGPTGSGKTLLVKKLAECLDVPFAMCDCTSITAAGYVGEDVESVIYRLLDNSDFDVDKCQQGIVYLDEVDKIRSIVPGNSRNVNSSRDVGGEGVQQAFLKLLESNVVNVTEKMGKRNAHETTYQVDTTNILFIASGAFTGITDIIRNRTNQKSLGFGTPEDESILMENEDKKLSDIEQLNVKYDQLLGEVETTDVVKFGLIPEFVGRFHIVVPLHSLSEDHLMKILTETKNSLIAQKEFLLAYDECQLIFTDSGLRAIAQKALKKKTGARGIHHILTHNNEVEGDFRRKCC
ncbi:ATP-dependent Clp protease ATP-binding subunit clpX-like, mitochondrial isoform X2 [Ostrea edulis]|uniref:ATP-dependent Clp protease ATP-binding subunit clpX-like, mitochondrial isoform X2 n=1 Tax=Ostrea edulis TaxID=37623 RepID=UPI0024AF25E4|nr:ATP-dependent Clp protease ATP-binding subunit clpX-like, mitochondrial isoform X2 [Ostrea edulis]